MNLFTLGWIVLFALGGVLEAVAVLNQQRGDTLSEHTWRLLGRRGLRVLFVCGWAWLTVHFVTGGWI